jgi:hypothetical protein
MSIQPEQRDLIPNTPTAAALRRAALEPVELRQPDGEPTRREIEIDPDAPNAPVCTRPKYITVDPDDPNAPTCKPKRYIVAPDPGTLGAKSLPDWARQLGDDLSESFGDRP